MSDDLIHDRGQIRDSDEPDARDSRYWAAIRRDREMQTVDAVTRLADSEQAGLQARLDQAEARVDQLLDRLADSIDVGHLAHQREWSRDTFGPGPRLAGVLDHIRKELDEIAADPTDLSEWVDVIILALDGAWRAGHDPLWIIRGIKAKQARNEARTWPDWRTADPDKAIEHVSEGES